MDQQDDKIQQMIDEGLIFGPDENNPPRADAPLVTALMQSWTSATAVAAIGRIRMFMFIPTRKQIEKRCIA